MEHVIGIGHSHLHAVSRALREREAAGNGLFRYTPVCLLDAPFNTPTHRGGEVIPDHPIVTLLRQAMAGPDTVRIFLAVGGSEAFRWSLIPGPAPFDFVDPDQDDGQPLQGELIPFGLMEQFAYEHLLFIADTARYVRQFAPLPLCQISPPPPVRDLPRMVEGLPDWKDRLGPYGISPLPFRSKVWRLTCRSLARICAEADIRWVPCPPEALSSDGGLHPDMQDDVIHANIVWGRLLATEVLGDFPLARGEAA